VPDERPKESETQVRIRTARERIRTILDECPDGLSRSELTRRVDANAGVVRSLLASMEAKGEITVEKVNNDHGGYTSIHRLIKEAEESDETA